MQKSILNVKNKFEQLNETLNFNHLVYAVNESMAIHRLCDKNGTVLLIAYPRYGRIGSQDNPAYERAMMLWVIEKAKKSYQSDNEEDESMDLLLQKAQELICAMEKRAENGCSFFSRVKWQSIDITPEYSVFGGFHGWLIDFIM